MIYHPDPEVELIESARFYERQVFSLGRDFLHAAELSVGSILDAPEHDRGWGAAISDAEFSFCGVSLRLAASPSHPGFQASHPQSGLLALPAFGVGRGEGEKFLGAFF